MSTGLSTIALAAAGFPIGLPLGPGIAIYLVASRRQRRAVWGMRTMIAMAVILGGYLVASAAVQHVFPWVELLHVTLLWSAFCFAGERVRLRREQILELKLSAVRERELATAEERTRIARDLHDSAGHAINVIAVRAGAARLRHHEDPGRSLQALIEIEELARRTAGEIDQFVGALRQSGERESVIAPPGVGSIPTLIEHHRAAGLHVELHIKGFEQPLPPAIDYAAYRIIQEALTNVSRHGVGTATLELNYRESDLEIVVCNRVGANRATNRAGHGLVGAEERAVQLGGSLIVECDSSMHTLRVCIPYGWVR